MAEAPKICDHTSVGIVIYDSEGKIAVIKRKNFPQCFALPAGHADGDENAVVRETAEEIGIELIDYALKHVKIYRNPCRRQGGNWHQWRVYEALVWNGELRAGSDATETSWMTVAQIRRLEDYTRILSLLPLFDLYRATQYLAGNLAWQKDPGLEPVWCRILTDLRTGIR